MKIALAGTGAMGVIHMKALQKIEGVEVVSIASRTEESGKAFADEWKIPFHSTNLEAVIDRPGVDAVILTTPSEQHADQTVLALSKGKHVQVEIPMALNLRDSERMLARSVEAGKTLMVTHTRRFSSPHREIKRRIRETTSPRHVPARIVQVAEIPRTKSGKIVELAVREVIHGREVKNKEALANPEALEFFRDRPELID